MRTDIIIAFINCSILTDAALICAVVISVIQSVLIHEHRSMAIILKGAKKLVNNNSISIKDLHVQYEYRESTF